MQEDPDSNARLRALDDRRRTVRITARDTFYSAFVKKLRWALPVAALAIVGILMIWPKIQMEIEEARFAPSQIDRATLEQAATENRLVNANFSSTDSKGRPFTITASEAVQENSNPDSIVLQEPRGKLQMDDEQGMTVESRHGTYAQADQLLNLMDDVVITRSDGTVMKTRTLLVNLMTNDARTETPVAIDGPQGTLRAQGMVTSGGGAVAVFTGPARLILNAKNSIDPQGGS